MGAARCWLPAVLLAVADCKQLVTVGLVKKNGLHAQVSVVVLNPKTGGRLFSVPSVGQGVTCPKTKNASVEIGPSISANNGGVVFVNEHESVSGLNTLYFAVNCLSVVNSTLVSGDPLVAALEWKELKANGTTVTASTLAVTPPGLANSKNSQKYPTVGWDATNKLVEVGVMYQVDNTSFFSNTSYHYFTVDPRTLDVTTKRGGIVSCPTCSPDQGSSAFTAIGTSGAGSIYIRPYLHAYDKKQLLPTHLVGWDVQTSQMAWNVSGGGPTFLSMETYRGYIVGLAECCDAKQGSWCPPECGHPETGPTYAFMALAAASTTTDRKAAPPNPPLILQIYTFDELGVGGTMLSGGAVDDATGTYTHLVGKRSGGKPSPLAGGLALLSLNASTGALLHGGAVPTTDAAAKSAPWLVYV